MPDVEPATAAGEAVLAAADKLFCKLVVDVECFDASEFGTDKGAFSAGVNDFLRFKDPTAEGVVCESLAKNRFH